MFPCLSAQCSSVAEYQDYGRQPEKKRHLRACVPVRLARVYTPKLHLGGEVYRWVYALCRIRLQKHLRRHQQHVAAGGALQASYKKRARAHLSLSLFLSLPATICAVLCPPLLSEAHPGPPHRSRGPRCLSQFARAEPPPSLFNRRGHWCSFSGV